ncbi:MAG: hypothetical protein KatS3mg031_1133 [Chitinophagales bacterium]|nr:MAG: hypothetical protein KatS3mg031_1133 [Chitinophagales bacterium]
MFNIAAMPHRFLWSLLIFTIAFWLWRLPFFLWIPLPEFAPDTFDYFALARLWHEGNIAHNYPLDAPLGFPLFILLTTLIGCNILTIIAIQCCIKFLAGATLLYTLYKYYPRWTPAFMLALLFYITDSFSLRYDTCLQTESLYNSAILFTTAFLVDSIRTNKNLPLFLLSLSMFTMAFIRSNGLFIYFLFPVLVVWLIFNQRSWRAFASLLLPALALQTVIPVLKHTTDYLPESSSRVEDVFAREKTAVQHVSFHTYLQKKISMAAAYLSMPDFPSFYFSLLPSRYEELYTKNMMHDPDYKMLDWTTPIPDELRKFTFREYYEEPERLRKNADLMQVSSARSNPLMLLIHIVYKIQNIIFRNLLWYVISFFLMAVGIITLLKSKYTNKEAMIILLIGLIHLLAVLVVIIGNSRVQLRYTHVSEFLLYLAPLMGMLLVFPHGKSTIR